MLLKLSVVLSLRPVTARARAKLGRTTIADEAVEIAEVSPASNYVSEAPVSLPDELDRIGCHAQGVDPAFNLLRLREGIVPQRASVGYRLRDAIIADGMVLGRRSTRFITPEPWRLALTGDLPEISEGALCTTYQNHRYFSHWLTDGLGTEELARRRGLTVLTLASSPHGHEIGYRALLGTSTRPITTARVKDLWIFDDEELNDGRVARLHHLRKGFRAVRGEQESAPVFIARGSTGAVRRLTNEAAIIDDLHARGFTILFPEQETPLQIVNTLAGAPLAIGVEGSALAHAAMALPERAGLVVIQPPLRFNTLWKGHSDRVGLTFGFTVADAVGENAFYQPLYRLLKTIDLVEAARTRG